MRIKDINGKEWEYDNCLSCAILGGSVELFGGKIFESKHFVVMQDFSRPIDGFVVICSKRHIKTYDQLSKEERLDFAELLANIETALKEIIDCKFFNIYLAEYNEGHFHVQVLPRYKWMEDERGTIIGNLNRGFNYAKENLNTTENLAKIKDTIEKLKNKLQHFSVQ